MQKISCKKECWCLGVCSVLLALFYTLKHSSIVMDFFTKYITGTYKRTMGAFAGMLPFSLAEVCYVALGVCMLLYVICAVREIVQQSGPRRIKMIGKKLLGVAAIACTLFTGVTLLWGANYYTTPFEEKAGIERRDISVQQLAEVTLLFANKVNDTAPFVQRDAQNLFYEEPETLLRQSKTLYQAIETTYPFLKGPQLSAKPMMFSWVMSVINYTGVFFPFTGEANVNMLAPLCFLPSTIAHELAHVRDIAPEQTANFVAVLACEASGISAYEYSGALLGYLHLANALFSADRAAWYEISQLLCEEAKADLAYNNTYWERYDTPAAAAANTVYDSFLQGFDQPLGLKSYGAVVDLLVAYYA